jgi:endonuclease YncB( thermonuclease family)
MWEYRAALPFSAIKLEEAIHDGDTVKILIDLGFDARTEKWIRLAGVRAPEIGQPGASATRAFVAAWLMDRAGYSAATRRRLRWPLRIETEMTSTPEPTERTSFTRYVGTIWDASGGGSLNYEVQAYLDQHPEWPAGRRP